MPERAPILTKFKAILRHSEAGVSRTGEEFKGPGARLVDFLNGCNEHGGPLLRLLPLHDRGNELLAEGIAERLSELDIQENGKRKSSKTS